MSTLLVAPTCLATARKGDGGSLAKADGGKTNYFPPNEPNVKPHQWKTKSSTRPMASKYKEPKTAPSCPQSKPPPAPQPSDSTKDDRRSLLRCGEKVAGGRMRCAGSPDTPLPVPITVRDTATTNTNSFPPIPPGRKVSLRWLIARAAARQPGEGNPAK
jgi:hypothetical protein